MKVKHRETCPLDIHPVSQGNLLRALRNQCNAQGPILALVGKIAEVVDFVAYFELGGLTKRSYKK